VMLDLGERQFLAQLVASSSRSSFC
jgi:hypothetical protein